MSSKAEKKNKVVQQAEVPKAPSKPLTGFLQYRMDVFKKVQA